MSEQRPNRQRLAEYYGTAKNESGKISDAIEPKMEDKSSSVSPVNIEKPVSSPYDVNSSTFDSDIYSQKLIKEASLAQLMAQEGEIVRQIHGLDSDMQTLVYENYNKFISATDTIKQMRVDFKDMEEEMDQLADKMKALTDRASTVNQALKGKRSKVAELSSTHALLKKLQFLFELPKKLKMCIEEENYKDGVNFYVKAERVLIQYEHMPSFHGIKKDCDEIVLELKSKLKQKLKDENSSPQSMADCVHLLMQLNEPVDELCQVYLSTSRLKLQESLASLEKLVEIAPNHSMDVLEFVTQACDGFISDLCLVIGAFNDTFNVEEPLVADKLNHFVIELIGQFIIILKCRLILEKTLSESALLARSIDRFYRRIQSICRLMPISAGSSQCPNVGSLTLSKDAMSLVLEIAKHLCQVALSDLKSKLDQDLLEIRKSLVTPRAMSANGPELRQLNRQLISGLNERLRTNMTHLQLFLDTELTFGVKTNFRTTFSRSFVREGVVVSHFRQILDLAAEFCSDDTTDRTVPPLLLLLLSRTCLDLESATLQNVMSSVDEQFLIDDTSGKWLYCTRNGYFQPSLIDY